MSTTDLVSIDPSEDQIRKSYEAKGGELYFLLMWGSSRDGVVEICKHRDSLDRNSQIKLDIARTTLAVMDGQAVTKEVQDTCCREAEELADRERE